MSLVSVHYHELALKGGNRPRFQRVLRQNLQQSLRGTGTHSVRSVASRFLIETEGDQDEIARLASRVCGVAHAMPVRRFPQDLDKVGAAIAAELAARKPDHFRISTKRTFKKFPLISMEVDRQLGAIVHDTTGIPVKLKGAEVDVLVSVLPEEILVAYERVPGPGGLPVGTGGRVAVLMSGGIDSPVAAWRMMNRGCRCDLIHFHSHPLVDRTTQEKARDLAEVLTRWQYQTRLHLVPLAQIQTEIRLHCPEAMRVVLYRRFMVRIAERIARRRRCRALVTGESLGQVASQTLDNIAAVDAVADIPILRPLVGTGKEDIVRGAHYIGSYDIAIRPDQDCCQLFVPQRPAIKVRRSEAEEAEQALDIDALVEDALERTEREDLKA